MKREDLVKQIVDAVPLPPGKKTKTGFFDRQQLTELLLYIQQVKKSIAEYKQILKQKLEEQANGRSEEASKS
jgi:hypothetical protein